MKPFLALIIAALSGTAPAAPPSPVVNVQGRAVVGGVSPTGTLQFKFALGDAADTQTYWRHDGVVAHGTPPDGFALTAPVRAGVFSVLLGDESVPGMASLDVGVFDQAQVVLRIWVSDGILPFQRLLPDRPLVASPYAVIAHSVEDAAITTNKIADGAVTFDKIQSGAVGAFSIDNSAVQSHAIAPAAVTGDKVAPAAIGGTHLANGSVSTSKISDDAVTGTKLADGAVAATQIADLAVTTAKINHFAVGRGQIQNGAIDSAKIGFGEVTANNLASASVTTDKIFESAVTGSKLAAGVVSFDKLEPGLAEELLSGGGGTQLPPSAMVVSEDPCDQALLSQGYVRTGTIPGQRSKRLLFPRGQSGHRVWSTAIWTGREVLTWGGHDWGNPAGLPADGWSARPYYNYPDGEGDPLSPAGQPAPRWGHSAVGTGRDMIVWGGYDANGHSLATGGAYTSPYPDTGWRPWNDSLANIPSPRGFHTAVWTGTEMIIWGGHFWDGGTEIHLNDGAAYNPATDTWRTLAPVPDGFLHRYHHTAVWTGEKMIVWGGRVWNEFPVTTKTTDSGAAYNPATDSWELLPNGPTARSAHGAIWTGKLMMVWGGSDSNAQLLENGGLFDPASMTWNLLPASPQTPRGIEFPSLVWMGDRVFVGGNWSHEDLHPREYFIEQNRWALVREVNFVRDATADLSPLLWTGEELVTSGPRGERYRPPHPNRYLYQLTP